MPGLLKNYCNEKDMCFPEMQKVIAVHKRAKLDATRARMGFPQAIAKANSEVPEPGIFIEQPDDNTNDSADDE